MICDLLLHESNVHNRVKLMGLIINHHFVYDNLSRWNVTIQD